MPDDKKPETKQIASNRKAFADYDFEDTFEAVAHGVGGKKPAER
jgi:tmRNA-binding protein